MENIEIHLIQIDKKIDLSNFDENTYFSHFWLET